VYWSDLFVGSALGNFGSAGPGSSDIFINQGDRVSKFLTDPKKVTVLFDQVQVVQPSISGVITLADISANISIEKAVKFNPGTNELNPRNLFISVISCTAQGVTGTTGSGTFIIGTDLIFKNSK
jgi:hypothetical protein